MTDLILRGFAEHLRDEYSLEVQEYADNDDILLITVDNGIYIYVRIISGRLQLGKAVSDIAQRYYSSYWEKIYELADQAELERAIDLILETVNTSKVGKIL